MEKKQNKLLLASAVFGALFVVGVVIFLVFVIKYAKDIDKLTEAFTLKAVIAGLAGIILLTVSTPLSFIFNLIGWIKGNNRHILASGILYVLSLNLVSAPLCFVEYFNDKRKIKNKLLIYAMIYAFIFSAIFIFGMLGSVGSDEFGVIYTILVVIAGFIINYFAWKTNNKKAKIIAGIVYIFTLNIVSAILCFISCNDNRKLPNAE